MSNPPAVLHRHRRGQRKAPIGQGHHRIPGPVPEGDPPSRSARRSAETEGAAGAALNEGLANPGLTEHRDGPVDREPLGATAKIGIARRQRQCDGAPATIDHGPFDASGPARIVRVERLTGSASHRLDVFEERQHLPVDRDWGWCGPTEVGEEAGGIESGESLMGFLDPGDGGLAGGLQEPAIVTEQHKLEAGPHRGYCHANLRGSGPGLRRHRVVGCD